MSSRESDRGQSTQVCVTCRRLAVALRSTGKARVTVASGMRRSDDRPPGSGMQIKAEIFFLHVGWSTLASGKQSVQLPWHLLRSLPILAKVVIISLSLSWFAFCLRTGDALHVLDPPRPSLAFQPMTKFWLYVGAESDSYVLRTPFIFGECAWH